MKLLTPDLADFLTQFVQDETLVDHLAASRIPEESPASPPSVSANASELLVSTMHTEPCPATSNQSVVHADSPLHPEEPGCIFCHSAHNAVEYWLEFCLFTFTLLALQLGRFPQPCVFLPLGEKTNGSLLRPSMSSDEKSCYGRLLASTDYKLFLFTLNKETSCSRNSLLPSYRNYLTSTQHVRGCYPDAAMLHPFVSSIVLAWHFFY